MRFYITCFIITCTQLIICFRFSISVRYNSPTDPYSTSRRCCFVLHYERQGMYNSSLRLISLSQVKTNQGRAVVVSVL